METDSAIPFIERVWCSCISPPAIRGEDGYYPVCFSFLFISLAAFIWYKIGESGNFEGPMLFFLPEKHAQTIRHKLASCRSILSLHGGLMNASGNNGKTKAASGPNGSCLVCAAAGNILEAASPPTARATASATSSTPRTTATECPAVREANEFLSAARNRCVGGYHAAAATFLAFCCVFLDQRLIQNKAKGTSPLFTATGGTTSGQVRHLYPPEAFYRGIQLTCMIEPVD